MPSNHPRYGFDRYSSIRIAYGPSFAPDGQHVSFISDITGVPQAWILDLATSRIDQLTLFNERVSSAVFSPTGKNLGLSMDPGGGERHQVWTLDMKNSSTSTHAALRAERKISSTKTTLRTSPWTG